MVMRKVAVVTLFQHLHQAESPDIDELDKQIRHVIESSLLSKSWRVDHVAFLNETLTDLEDDQSNQYEGALMSEKSHSSKRKVST